MRILGGDMNSIRLGQAASPVAPALAGLRLRRERTVLLAIDLQEKLMPAILDGERVVSRTVFLLEAARILDMPVLLTTQYRKGLGDIVPAVRDAAPGVDPFDKVTFGCFGCEPLVEWFVQRPARDQLLVAGVESHVCVFQTVAAALERGLTVHVASDAISARRAADGRAGLDRMERSGAVLTSAEMAIYELVERSDDEAFRKLLPLVKKA